MFIDFEMTIHYCAICYFIFGIDVISKELEEIFCEIFLKNWSNVYWITYDKHTDTINISLVEDVIWKMLRLSELTENLNYSTKHCI